MGLNDRISRGMTEREQITKSQFVLKALIRKANDTADTVQSVIAGEYNVDETRSFEAIADEGAAFITKLESIKKRFQTEYDKLPAYQADGKSEGTQQDIGCPDYVSNDVKTILSDMDAAIVDFHLMLSDKNDEVQSLEKKNGDKDSVGEDNSDQVEESLQDHVFNHITKDVMWACSTFFSTAKEHPEYLLDGASANDLTSEQQVHIEQMMVKTLILVLEDTTLKLPNYVTLDEHENVRDETEAFVQKLEIIQQRLQEELDKSPAYQIEGKNEGGEVKRQTHLANR